MHAMRGRAIAAVVTALCLSLAGLGWASPASAAESPQPIPSDRETVPGAHSGDSIDDPAIWVNPVDSSRSLVIANDKQGALNTYDLDGQLVQTLSFGTEFWGNVDVRQAVTIGGVTRDLVGAVEHDGVRFYSVDPVTRQLSPVTEGDATIGASGEGFCMYHSPTTGKVYGFVITQAGTVRQFQLTDPDGDGLLASTIVRTFAVGSEAEGCVADDATGALYVSQEDVALWRYGAEPGDGTTRVAVDTVTASGGHLAPDIEGLTIVDLGDGHGYLIASAQNESGVPSYFGVYRREAGNEFVKTFRIVDGTASDDCDHTDGVAAVFANLGPAFPKGMFVCQDNNNDAPGTSGHQDVKMTGLEKVVDLSAVEPPPGPQPSSLGFVGQSTVNGNRTSFTVQVPSGVRAGDTLLLFDSQASTATLTGPGAGWTQIGRTTDTKHATTVWRRTATDADADSTVRLSTGGGYLKAGLTLAAYRGTDPGDPVAAIAGAPEPASTAAHTTPVVTDTTDGAWRVSYWSDKNSATTAWTDPPGETRRTSTTGSGGGRIDTLLTDSDAPVATGSQGGLTATADAASSTATTWTVLLRPADDSLPPVVNHPPTARFGYTCTKLVCDFDGSASSDAEGDLAAYSWDFGDGGTSDQVAPTHTFGSPGSRQVTLTVTDGDQAIDRDTRTVSVDDGTAQAPVSFVGQSAVNGNKTSFAVEVPAGVRAGDALLLFASQAGTGALTGPGAGWTQVGRTTDTKHATTVWSRVATGSDVGSTVEVSTGTTYTKLALTLAAYRGTDPTDPVGSVAGVAEPGDTAAHTTPVVDNTVTGAWRVSYWSDKSSATTSWTGPAGDVVRATTAGTGGGHVATVLTDSGGSVASGAQGGLVGTASDPSSSATSWTLLLRPAPTG